MTEDEYEIRRGNGYKWAMSYGYVCNVGFTVDDLNTKEKEEAESLFEEIFIDVRKVLETMTSRCLDEEDERLQVCHEVSRALTRNFKTYSK